MKPDLLDELRAADPARATPAATEPSWDAMARRILATPRRPRGPRRPRRRRVALVLAPIAGAAALVAVAIAALIPGSAPPSVLERAYSAVSENAIYHYLASSQELEGPQRRPIADTRSTREGWIDPTTGEIHEIYSGGDEWATDGRRRTMYTAFNDSLQQFDEPSAADTAAQAPGDVLRALTRSFRAGSLRDEGSEVFEGRRVRRLVATNPTRTWRQTFLVDADSYLPVLFVSETGDYIREGTQIPRDQRVIEERFDRFERLPEGSDRSLLKMRPHPGARRQPPVAPPRPARP
jgi:hypothetical protein